jgi:hypothetical protein
MAFGPGRRLRCSYGIEFSTVSRYLGAIGGLDIAASKISRVMLQPVQVQSLLPKMLFVEGRIPSRSLVGRPVLVLP